MTEIKINDDSFLDEARNYLGDYCMNVCNAQCCKRGYIVLYDQEQVDTVISPLKEEVILNGFLKKNWDDTYSLFVGNKLFNCPSLIDGNKCGVYKNKNRPLCCHKYPLHLFGKNIVCGPCPAVENGILDKYFEKFKEMGYKII